MKQPGAQSIDARLAIEFPASDALVVDDAAVLRAILLPAAGRPARFQIGDAPRRHAMAVAFAIWESTVASRAGESRAVALDGRTSPGWPVDEDAIAALTWLRPSQITNGLTTCLEAGVLSADGNEFLRRGIPRSVRLAADVLRPHAVAAQVDWEGVRTRLSANGERRPATLAVLRALAGQTGALEQASGAGQAVPTTLKNLADATFYERRTASDAVTALIRAGLIDAVRQPGLGGFCLLAAAFEPAADSGQAAEEQGARLPSPEGPAASAAPPGATPDTAPPYGRGDAGRPQATAEDTLECVAEIGGRQVTIGAGIPVSVESGAPGESLVRIGPLLLRIRPASPS